MKLKGLPNRLYNIFFHTHTVSGIVLSFGLYVIFFAGAFTLFRSEFYQWENPEARQPYSANVDYDALLAALKKHNPKFNLGDDITLRAPTHAEPRVTVYGHLIVPKGKPEEHYHTAYLPQTGHFGADDQSTIGETLYRLHFFDQIPFYIGRYISGFVALFFLFATATGVLIHWRNILSKFYGFSFKGAWKQVWTNAHIVFGMIGLPFQLMYAVTGAFYILSILILLPVVMLFYNGDQQKVFAMIRPNEGLPISATAPAATGNLPISKFLSELKAAHPELEVYYMQLKNYDKQDALLTVSVTDRQSFTGDGYISYRLRNGKTELDLLPGKKNYTQSVLFGIGRLHFATFGGLMLKSLYFILALFTCFVIISGVLLWKEARNKKSYTDKQKRFQHRVTMVYLAICFGLFPATAIIFSTELLVPTGEEHAFQVNTVFFVSWLLLTAAGLFLKSEARLTRFYLWTGGILSLIIPLTNGIATGDWFWITLSEQNFYLAGTDIFWLLTGITSLFYAVTMSRRGKSIGARDVENTERPAKRTAQRVAID